MKVVEHYIIKEIVPYFILTNIFFIFLLLLDKLLDAAEFIFARNADVILLLELFLFSSPSFFVLTIPTSMLLATVVAFNRFSSDTELIVMKTSGAYNKIFIRPLILLSLLGLFMSLICSMYLSPLGNKLAWNNFRIIAQKFPIDDIVEKQLYDKIPGLLIYVNKKINNNDFQGVLIYNKNTNMLIVAEKGLIKNDSNGLLHFYLKNGSLIENSDEFTHIDYNNFRLNFNIAKKLTDINRDEMFMGPLDLFNSFHKDPVYKFQFSANVALPFATIIMALCGYLIGINIKYYSKSLCIFFSFLVIFTYNTIFIFFKSLIYEHFNPFLAAWMPNILFMLLLFIFMLKKRI